MRINPKNRGKVSIYLDETAYTEAALTSGDFHEMAYCDYNMLVHGTPEGDVSEEWKKIALNSEYEVSSNGNVRRISIIDLKIQKAKRHIDYPSVNARRPGCLAKTLVHIHRLVAKAFLGPKPEGFHIRHLTGDKNNYHANALAYGTPKQNYADKFAPAKNLEAPVIEEWRYVPDYIGLWVSNCGRARQVTVTVITPTTSTYQSGKRKGQKKHVCVSISLNNQKRVYRGLHVLVREAFNGEVHEGMVVGHCDGNPHNNRLSNLKVITYRENAHDRFLHNTNVSGSCHPNSKLNENQVKCIVRDLINLSVKDIAEKNEVCEGAIYKIMSGEYWSNITGIQPRLSVINEVWWNDFRDGVRNGITNAILAQKYGLSISQANRYSRFVLNAGL